MADRVTDSADGPPRGVIEAAGGVLWRDGPTGRELALVHRPRHDDWALPKGKLHPDESWQGAALREVREETGCQVALGPFLDSLSYTVAGVPKVVLFWEMQLDGGCTFCPNDEVDQLAWLAPPLALRRMTYHDERALLRRTLEREH